MSEPGIINAAEKRRQWELARQYFPELVREFEEKWAWERAHGMR